MIRRTHRGGDQMTPASELEVRARTGGGSKQLPKRRFIVTYTVERYSEVTADDADAAMAKVKATFGSVVGAARATVTDVEEL